jgi:hypothetical protein
MKIMRAHGSQKNPDCSSMIFYNCFFFLKNNVGRNFFDLLPPPQNYWPLNPKHNNKKIICFTHFGKAKLEGIFGGSLHKTITL